MLLFDFSDKSLRVLKTSPRFLGGNSVSGFAQSGLPPGLIEGNEIRDTDALAKEVQEILKKGSLSDQEASFVLHDERSFNLRLPAPVTADTKVNPILLEKQLAALLPAPISTLVYDAWNQQFAAIDKEIFSKYLELFGKLGLKPHLAVPESQAIWAFLLPHIGEEEVVAFLEIETATTDVIILDRKGILQTFTEPIETSQLIESFKNVSSFFQSRFDRKIGKIFLGGGGAGALDPKVFSEKMGIPAVSCEEVLKSYPSIAADFGQNSKLDFIALLGLALLGQQKSPLNFVR